MRLAPLARRIDALRSLLGASVIALLLSCGGGGGGGGGAVPEEIGVFTGVAQTFDFNWESPPGGGGGDGGVGGGADGDGGVGVGGDLGQFRKALVVVQYPDGRPVGNGSALTDEVNGMVTIKPGREYEGALYIEIRGTAEASFYEEGKDTFVPFPVGQVIRGWIPKIDKNIGITPFTDVAARLLREGSTPEQVPAGTPTPAQIGAANDVVRRELNRQFPLALEVDDITRLPFIKSPAVAAGAIGNDPRGRYGLVNGAFSKQAAVFNAGEATPTLAATRQLGEDMLDGKLDGTRNGQPAVPAEQRTYDPHTLTGELSSALAGQAFRFGNNAVQLDLPTVLSYGNSRYQGYLFDAALKRNGRASTTVAGWVGDNTQGRSLGQEDEKLPGTPRVFGLYGNFGHGSVFLKSDAPNSQSKVYALGDNVNGELGLGSNYPQGTAGVAIELALPGVLTHIAGGFAHTVARLADGSVYTWGDNSYAQLGQGSTSVPARADAPVRVSLPQGALAVAASSTASYALLADGSVYSWGSSLGFGLLGDGAKDGTRTSPAPVASLADVVQIAARDNDAMALKRDGTVLTWGSFPPDPNGGFVPSDVGLPYRGGTLAPTPVTGIPGGTQIRKILTEQGLFNALAADGKVYAWGVHFDLTANDILPDTTASPVLGLPRVRDLMPGGFFGYGQRPFDRLTGLAIDYRGNTWKVRGRVAEQFDPTNPSQQRRPRGQAPRPDCASCHLLLTDWPLVAPPATSNTVCVPPPSIHGEGASSLIHEDTPCEQCHNPARTVDRPSFTNGWLNCLRPTLPVRQPSVAPPETLGACTLPTGHVYTPPGTVCASCHNSIVARPLQSLNPPCGQPPGTALPSIATSARIDRALNDTTNAEIARGASTNDPTPVLQGTLSAALQAGQVVRVTRNGASPAPASVSGTAWSFTDTPAGDGSRTYTARVEAGASFGPVANSYQFFVDTAAPTSIADVTTISDDISGVVTNETTSDTTPTVSGTLRSALGPGESVQLQRRGTVVTGSVGIGPNGWTYTEPSPLAAGTYDYQARVVDIAGNASAFGTRQSVTINTSFPLGGATTFIERVNTAAVSGGAVPVNNDATPTLEGRIQRTLIGNPPEQVRIYRKLAGAAGLGNPVGVATVVNISWSFTSSPAITANGTYVFTARIERTADATTFGEPGSVSDPIDIEAPTQRVTISATSNRAPFTTVSGAVPPDNNIPNLGRTNDTSPTLLFVVTPALNPGDSLVATRDGTSVTPLSTTCPGGTPAGSVCFRIVNDFISGLSITTPPTTPSVTPAGAAAAYSAHVRDQAGNAGTAGTLSFDFDYFTCNQARAHFAASNGASTTSGHVPISRSAAPSRNCSDCHDATSPPTPINEGTLANTFVPVPQTTPSYWCRRPP